MTALLSILALGAYQLIPENVSRDAEARSAPISPRIAAWLERKAIPMPQHSAVEADRSPPIMAAAEKPQIVQRIIEPKIEPQVVAKKTRPKERARTTSEVSAARQQAERDAYAESAPERRSSNTPWMERLGD